MAAAICLLITLVNLRYALSQGGLSQPASSLAIGSVQECTTIADDINYCSEYVTYEVPASIAWLAEIIESDIRNRVETPDIGNCREVLKETYCKKKFPRCSMENNMVVFERSANCTERLQRNCATQAASLIKVGFCNITQAPLDSGTCEALSGYTDLQHCSLLGTGLHVSNWMYQYILQTDLELQRSFQFLGNQMECWELYRGFICTSLGRCVGEQVHLTNTQEMCESVLNW